MFPRVGEIWLLRVWRAGHWGDMRAEVVKRWTVGSAGWVVRDIDIPGNPVTFGLDYIRFVKHLVDMEKADEQIQNLVYRLVTIAQDALEEPCSDEAESLRESIEGLLCLAKRLSALIVEEVENENQNNSD